MKISEIQGIVKTLIAADAALVGNKLATIGVTIEGELDGDGRQVDFDDVIADGIITRGLHIGILQPSTAHAENIHDGKGSGLSHFWCSIPVLLCEAPHVNRDASVGGLNRNPLEVIEAILEAVLKKPVGPFGNPFKLSPEPYFKTEFEGGIQYFTIFQAKTFI